MIELKGFKGFQTDDGQAYTATLYLDGKKAGTVTQHGHGGSNFYHFQSKDVKAACEAEASEWYRSQGKDPDEPYAEPLDHYVARLIDDIELLKQAKRLAKRTGAPIVALFQHDVEDWTREGPPAMRLYAREYLTAARTDADLERQVAKEKPEAWRVIYRA